MRRTAIRLLLALAALAVLGVQPVMAGDMLDWFGVSGIVSNQKEKPVGSVDTTVELHYRGRLYTSLTNPTFPFPVPRVPGFVLVVRMDLTSSEMGYEKDTNEQLLKVKTKWRDIDQGFGWAMKGNTRFDPVEYDRCRKEGRPIRGDWSDQIDLGSPELIKIAQLKLLMQLDYQAGKTGVYLLTFCMSRSWTKNAMMAWVKFPLLNNFRCPPGRDPTPEEVAAWQREEASLMMRGVRDRNFSGIMCHGSGQSNPSPPKLRLEQDDQYENDPEHHSDERPPGRTGPPPNSRDYSPEPPPISGRRRTPPPPYDLPQEGEDDAMDVRPIQPEERREVPDADRPDQPPFKFYRAVGSRNERVIVIEAFTKLCVEIDLGPNYRDEITGLTKRQIKFNQPGGRRKPFPIKNPPLGIKITVFVPNQPPQVFRLNREGNLVRSAK